MSTVRPLLAALALYATASTLPAATDTWTNLDGQSMQAEFLGRKGDYVSFQRADGSKYLYPYEKLSEPDRARVDALLQAKPELKLAQAPSTTPSAPAVAQAPAGRVAAALSGKLVSVQNGKLAPVPAADIKGARYIALYYSAKWCPPCRAFTPDLAKSYQEIKAQHPEFELVFVSSDEDAAAMADYMSSYGMGFPGVKFEQRRSIRALERPDHERGIPNLVFMDADGKELSVSYTPDGDYLGPRKVLADIRKHFRM